MKIAQVSPLYESVPPKLYGGTERIVSYLTEELAKKGHDVTLFASGDSQSSARLVDVCPEALRLNNCKDPLVYHVVMMQLVNERLADFDIVHYHIDYLHFPLSRLNQMPHLTTLHGRLDLPDLQAIYNTFPDMPVVSISNAQRNPLPQANFRGTVYHGLPLNLYKKGKGKGDYALFIGRTSPEKKVDRAIEIAGKAGMKIKIAAKIDHADQAYFDSEIKHLFDLPHVEYIGEVGEKEKQELYENAACLLFPINWPEPFGMVMIEAMACGTPVVAYNHGSVPEVIDNEVTGYIVNSIDEAVEKVKKIHDLDRNIVRKVFEERFSASRMADEYIKLYEKQIAKHKGQATKLEADKNEPAHMKPAFSGLNMAG